MPKVSSFKDSGCCPKILDDHWPLKNIPKLFQGLYNGSIGKKSIRIKKKLIICSTSLTKKNKLCLTVHTDV